VRVNLHRGVQMLREKLAEGAVPSTERNARANKASGQNE